MYNIKLVDKLAPAGRKQFKDYYTILEDVENPDGILVHSTPLHEMVFGDKLKCIVRIGEGVKTIPVDRCTRDGICVFNCPGGNANAVKELTLSAMIMLMRNGFAAQQWVKSLSHEESSYGKGVEKGKEQFKIYHFSFLLFAIKEVTSPKTAQPMIMKITFISVNAAKTKASAITI